MNKEEKVYCMKQVDLCYTRIKQLEKAIEKYNKLISQGITGIIFGILSLIFGVFEKICFFGLAFGGAGFLLWILNYLNERAAQAEVESTISIMNQWK